MHARSRIAALLVLAATTACTTYTSGGFPFPTPAARAGVASGPVQFVDSAGDRPYVVLGKVHAHGRCNWFFGFLGCGEERLRQTLLDEAGKLGATAVIDVRSKTRSRFEWRDVHFYGTAIAYLP